MFGSLWSGLTSVGQKNFAIDLGSENTAIYVDGAGVVLKQPSVIAIENSAGLLKVVAVGDEAKRMLGRSPQNIFVSRPMRAGAVADFELAEQLLKRFMQIAFGHSRQIRQPLVAISVPSDATSVERRAIHDAALNAGAADVTLIDKPFAAAMGAGIISAKPEGSMIVEVGGGTTDFGIVSMGSLVRSTSVRLGGGKLDEAIVNYVRRRYNFLIGETTAEQIKIKYGSALPPALGQGDRFHIVGNDLQKGKPGQLELAQLDLHLAMTEIIDKIVRGIISNLDSVDPELSGDIIANGITLSGGSSLVAGLDTLIETRTGLKVRKADDPFLSVVLGTMKAMSHSGAQPAL